MSYTTVGTCGNCGGAVTIPTIWGSVEPATPTCNRCGAEAAMHGPVLPMKRAPVMRQFAGTHDYSSGKDSQTLESLERSKWFCAGPYRDVNSWEARGFPQTIGPGSGD